LIAEAMAKVGREGVITVQDGKGLETEVSIIEGMKFDNGALSRFFFTDTKAQNCVFEDPLILICENKISNVQELVPLLEKILRSKKKEKLLIIAENVEGDALSTLILNKVRGLEVCAVKAPGFGDGRTNNLQDIAVLTGGTLVSEDAGVKLEDIELEDLGRAKKITVTSDDTLILDGGGSKASIHERCDLIRASLERATSDWEREKCRDRLAKLSGGVAVLKVGGASELEVSEKKDRIEDALNATRAAVAEGVVPGGGVALLYASKPLIKLQDELKSKNFDQAQGVQIVRDALKTLTRTIAQNAGDEGSVVVQTLLGQDKVTWGYDAQNGVYCDLMEAGIIDPTKVVRTALVDAASVAALMATTECIICDVPKPDSAPAGGMGGGMGGMGGMGGY